MRPAPTDSIDVVLFSVREARLAVLLVQDGLAHAREHWSLPWNALANSGTLAESAERAVLRAAGIRTDWLVQAGAFADGTRHPGGARLSVAYLGVVPRQAGHPAAGRWFPVNELPMVPPRHRAILDAVLAELRERVGQAPIAFRLLGDAFTLSDLQAVYELLLGRRLHKASFRRALKAASLVEPADEWRSEGRGRPARLYRYAPAPRSGARSGLRFDLSGD